MTLPFVASSHMNLSRAHFSLKRNTLAAMQIWPQMNLRSGGVVALSGCIFAWAAGLLLCHWGLLYGYGSGNRRRK